MSGASKAGDRGLQLFVHVQERGRDRDARANRECQTVGLTRAVIGILAENDDFDVAQLGKAKRIEDVFLRWVDGDPGLALFGDGLQCIEKIGLLLSSRQHVMPG